MLGLLLLTVALFLYFNPKKRWISYFLYTSFMVGYGGGFGLWTDSVLGIKNADMAVVYTFIVSVYMVHKGQYRITRFSFIRSYVWLMLFLICSVAFSLFYYKFGAYYVLQGSRGYLLFLSLPILSNISSGDFQKLMRAYMWVTTITSVLYILQIILGRPIMPYGDGTSNSYLLDESTGLVRLYNSPVYNTFFLCLTFVYPGYFGRRVNVFRVVYFMALMSTLGRTGIFTSILTVGLAMFFTGKVGKMFKMSLVLGILFIPFIDMLSNRFEKGGTETDIQTLLRGGASTYESGDGGTMTYRMAWVLERCVYLSERPIGEQIFGLGLITDSYPDVLKLYRFKLGLYNEQTGDVNQMNTPDIAYGNLVSNWGYGGSVIYLFFVFSLIRFFYKNRKSNPFVTVAAASLAILPLVAFAGNNMSQPSSFVIYFVILSTMKKWQCLPNRTLSEVKS